MRVGTPLGEYPFEFRRIERRDGAVEIVGTVAGLESSVVFDAADLYVAVRLLMPAIAAAGVLIYLRRRRALE